MTDKYLRDHSSDSGLVSNTNEWLFNSESTNDSSGDEEQPLDAIRKYNFSEQSRLLKGQAKISDLLVSKKIGINPFAGVYLSTITCVNCDKDQEIHRWEVAYDLSLQMRPTITEALNQYFRGEFINDYTCIRCSVR